MAGENEPIRPRGRRTFTRRKLLAGTAVGAGALAGADAASALTIRLDLSHLPLIGPLLDLLQHEIENLLPAIEAPGPVPTPGATTRLFRREDMLDLEFSFYNLTVSNGMLRRTGSHAVLVVGFAPQAIGEQWFPDPSPGSPVNVPAPNPSVVASPSRLAFVLPPGVNEVPFTADGLLSWGTPTIGDATAPAWTQSITPNASSSGRNATGLAVPPGPEQTSIEIPWGLELSPDESGRWRHSARRLTTTVFLRNGSQELRTELWQTHAARPDGDDVSTDDVPLRAVNHKPRDPSSQEPPLNAKWRGTIVAQTSLPDSVGGRTPVRAKLALGALGGSLHSHGEWQRAPISAWDHVATQGRDHYVRVEQPGFLFPFGHRAALITVFDREVRGTTNGDSAAAIIGRRYVAVRQPTIDYTTLPAPARPDYKLPFSTVTIVNSDTPEIELFAVPGAPQAPPGQETNGWVQTQLFRGRSDLPFHLRAVDFEHNSVSFTASLYFIPADVMWQNVPNSDGIVGVVERSYLQDTIRHTIDLHGQTFAYSRDVADARPAASAHATDSIALAVIVPPPAAQSELVGTDTGRMIPFLALANVYVPAADHLANQPPAPRLILPDRDYFRSGPNPMTGQYAKFFNEPVLEIDPRHSGPIVAPSFVPTALSALRGVVPHDLNDLVNNPDLATLLAGLFGPSATLLGVVPIGKLLASTIASAADRLEQVPKMLRTVEQATASAEASSTITLIFQPTLQPFKGDPPLPLVDHIDPATKKMSLTVTSTVTAKVDASASGSVGTGGVGVNGSVGASGRAEIKAEIRNLKIQLFSSPQFLTLYVDHVTFTSVNGGKPDVDVGLDLSQGTAGIEFGGALSFVKPLEDLLKSLGSNPLQIGVTPEGISAGLNLAIPSVAVGVFSLQHMAFTASLTLPFTGDPAQLRFAFCSRERPFLLTVGVFGGGGYVTMHLGLNGMKFFELSLDFGGAFALDVGVASGGVSVMAGIYFSYDDIKGIDLAGFFRAEGSVEVLGLVTISTVFSLTLGYMAPIGSGSGSAYGVATFSLSIDVTFFSTSVSFEVEKQFSGGGDPTFGDMYGPDDWATYCDAFAQGTVLN